MSSWDLRSGEEPPRVREAPEAPAWAQATIADRHADDKERLARDLELLPMRELRAIGNRYGWGVRGASKREITRQLAEHLSDPRYARQAYDALDDEERRVLRAVMMLGDRLGTQEAVPKLARAFGPLRRHKHPIAYLDTLVQSGLVVPHESSVFYGAVTEMVPRAVARVLPPALEGVLADAAARDPQILAGDTSLADPTDFLRACGYVLMLLEETPASPRPPTPPPAVADTFHNLYGWDYVEDELREAQQRNHLTQPHTFALSVPTPQWSLSDESVARLAPVVGGEERLDLIYALLAGAEILRIGKAITVNPEAKAQYLMRDPAGQRAILARAYFEATLWSEVWAMLRRNPGLRLRRYIQPYRPFRMEDLRTDLVELRGLALQIFAGVPDGQWVSVEELFALLSDVWGALDPLPLALVAGPRYVPWDVRALRDDGAYDTPAWDDAQGAFLRIMLAEPLHWLGLVDLIRRQGRVEAVRFHGLADLWLDRVEAPPLPSPAAPAAQPPTGEALRVEQRGEATGDVRIIVAASAVSAQAHGLLARIARLERATLDGFTYVLAPEMAYTAFETGDALADLLEAWDRLLPVPMPPPVRRKLEDWWEAYGRVRVYQDVAVIEFGDDYALAEMRAATSLDDVLVAEVSPRAVVVPREAVARLVAELERAGYTPKRTDTI